MTEPVRRLQLTWLLLAAFLPTACLAQTLEVITLKYRNAQQVVPMLQPLVTPGGTLSGMNNRIFVRTTPANLAELKRVLAVVDVRPRQLRISVRQDADVDRSRRSAQLSGTVELGKAGRVTVGGAPHPADSSIAAHEVEARVTSSDAQRFERAAQSVTVLEGNAAFIAIGRSVPMTAQQVFVGPDGALARQSTQYSDIDRGFYVTPRLNGDRVTLEISTTNDRAIDPSTGVSSIQQVQTVVSGRLGDWIELGATGEARSREDSVILGRTRNLNRDERRVLLQVEEVE